MEAAPPPSGLMIATVDGGDLRRAATNDGVGGSSNAKYKLMSPAKLPISRSSCLTIPPGLSPTSFLESPVLLSNFKGEPSPTTGSFFHPQMMNDSSGGSTAFPSIINSSTTLDDSKSSGFEFKPRLGSYSTANFSMAGHVVPSADMNQQQVAQAAQVQSEFQLQASDTSITVKDEVPFSNELQSVLVAPASRASPDIDSDEINQGEDSNNEAQVPQSEQKVGGSHVITDRTSDDGYNWRKYGQKLVKGSEYPRSYYKCTHPNCEVKKLFERSPDGQITEIIYKGTHDHPKPQPNRRLAAGSLVSALDEKSERVPVLTDQEAKPANLFGQSAGNDESSTPDILPGGANDNNGEGGLLNRSTDDADDDDPFAKRRRMEGGEMDFNSVVKPIREPRVVVQTVSEVDILDDGYRWRKYGQKVVRGNPNPRSYYKCTHPGCPVRKHVERASHDPKAVITTYEGKHNHEVPTARNSSHDTVATATASLATRIGSHEGSEQVSLDLGVGIRSAPEFVRGQQLAMEPERIPGQTHFSSPNLLLLQRGPLSTFPSYVNGGMVLYGSRENHSQAHSVGNAPEEFNRQGIDALLVIVTGICFMSKPPSIHRDTECSEPRAYVQFVRIDSIVIVLKGRDEITAVFHLQNPNRNMANEAVFFPYF
ncbi:hypothetical protein Cgig2_001565 [Carnegiea gigantea]|uniref:WRKY domain-containing protein n=1 Tax=Carnegiea gigantea TaxID=171969 RepID=A0A9Q1JVL2_9CARY|nr:hypothetical protein Cgig2_001565 [Carnegiea gigantea]